MVTIARTKDMRPVPPKGGTECQVPSDHPPLHSQSDWGSANMLVSL